MQLEEATGRSGKRVADAILPCLQEWIGRAHEDLTFRTTQVLAGHGCFGEYLHKVVRKECASRCHHCDAAEDTAQHTLGECPAWEGQRRVLASVVGVDFSPPALIRAMLGGREVWSAVTSFCEEVMSQKKEQERARRGEVIVGGGRVRRAGCALRGGGGAKTDARGGRPPPLGH
ncbi:uncharacterized protein LOC116850245 [Odontomachus brunneus]|uniref:uncharacterized protein LOC116850245 n=1 Tax=Odontomachus brunneus TaxID=486640 RepID=UPI0013F20C4D|nr:uncharacterized protein LOC116850245 [Odontomachus brunneus]